MIYSSKQKKISNLGSLDVISGDILDRRDGTILNFFELLADVRNLWNGSAFE